MARVFLKTFQNPDAQWHRGRYELIRLSAELAGGRKHCLTDDPEAADLILICDEGPAPYQRSIRHSPFFRRYWRKCFVIDPEDMPIAFLPGIYASIEQPWHDPAWTRSGFYPHIAERERFDFMPFNPEARWLYSFVGSCCNAAVRLKLQEIADPRFRLVDTSGKMKFIYRTDDQDDVALYKETVRESRFVLCPRGVGCSSIRLFETMRMGRAPVILSDDWVEPDGPAWSDFAVRVPERDVLELPRILADLEPRAAELAARARAEWERWFGEEVLFETVVDWCLAIRDGGRCESRLKRWGIYLQYLRRGHCRNFLRTKWKSLRGR